MNPISSRNSLFIAFLLLQCFVLIVIIAIQYLHLGKVKNRAKSVSDKLDKLVARRNSYGFPMNDADPTNPEEENKVPV